MRRARCLSLALSLVVGFVAAASAAPQWQADGTPVCTNGGIQTDPLITSDGAGGAYVAWGDYRNGFVDVYLQRVTDGGAIALGWPQDGLGVCTATEDQYVLSLAPDGSGGVYVAWLDYRALSTNDGDVYAHHLLADGSVAPGWPADGLPIASLPGLQEYVRVAGDGQGGAFIVWEDHQNDASGDWDVYMQHVTYAGALAPNWPVGGRGICIAPGFQGAQVIVADGSGGAFVAWGDTRDFATNSTEVYALRVTPEGDPAPGWVANGNVVCSAPGVQGNYATAPDGSGGIYVAWNDLRTAPLSDPFDDAYSDVYLQHVSGAGVLDPAWPPDGLAVCTAPFIQQTIDLTADGFGGALLSWEDYRSFVNANVYVQRVTASGALLPGWPVDGLRASTAGGYQVGPVLAADGLGGAYLVFESINVTHVVVAQHLTGSAEPAPGWPAEGIPVAMVPGTQSNPSIVADGLGGAIVAWDDTRNGYDIYAHRLGPSGPTPVLISLVSAEADGGVVRLAWYAADAGALEATVERRAAQEGWNSLASIPVAGDGFLRYEDRAVVPGQRYTYRLSYRDGTELHYSPEITVEVPAFRFALRGVTPNPSAGDPVVHFALPSDASATLELFDLNGRLILSHEVGSLGPGAHDVNLSPHGRLPAGVYAIRLRQGQEMATARAAIIR